MKKFQRLLCILSVLTLGTFAHAATIYPAGVPTVQACEYATKPLQDILAPLPYPSDWKVIVACTDAQWQDVTRHFDVRNTDTAFTILGAKVTVINGAIFKSKIYSRPEHTLRHEVGHITCESASEGVAEKYADKGVCR